MNKTFKTVWNNASGQWVATSEHARSHGKTTSVLSKAALALAVTVSGANSYALTITDGEPVPNPISDTDVRIHDGNFQSTTGSTFIINSPGSTEVIAENINVSSSNTLGNYASGFGISGATGAHLELKGNNTLTLDAATGDTAVIVSTSAGAGDARITVSGTLNINNQASWRIFENDGLEANAGANGNSIITHTGTGTIQVAGGHAVQARAAATGNNVEVTLNSTSGKDQIHLSTTGSGDERSSAIGAKGSATSGKVTVNTNAKITTTGGDAHGIYATSAGTAADGKSVEVINSGTISATGTNASGITALATAPTANGTVTINNTGKITSARHGLHGLGYNSDVALDNDGVLVTTGTDGAGIRAEQNIASTTGNITVTTGINSDITTQGVQSEGIHAYLGQEDAGGGNKGAASSGNVTVNAQGKITTNGNGSAEGIFAGITDSHATGNIDVTFRGSTIETKGTGANRGILVRQYGTGDVTVNHFGNLIKTAGDGGNAISIGAGLAGTDGATSTSMGKIELNTTGKIETSGSTARGIHL
ncbi:MAG: ESPR-type extended signal peptide-containing protein, partial [Saezia sp.]